MGPELPPTELTKTWQKAQAQAKQKESEESPVTQKEPETPGTPEGLPPSADRKDLIALKYTRPLPGGYRMMSVEICTTQEEINTPGLRQKAFAAIQGEKIFIEVVDKEAKDIKPLSGISTPPPTPDDAVPSTTGRKCDLCGSDLVFKKGYNQEKKKPWAAFFCPMAGKDVIADQRCSAKPQWTKAK